MAEMAEADEASEHDLVGRRRSRGLLVWKRPRNDLWNNTYVCVNLDSVVCKGGSVLANDGGLERSAHANGNWCRDVNVFLLWQSWTCGVGIFLCDSSFQVSVFSNETGECWLQH